MVTKTDLQEALSLQFTDIQKLLDDSVAKIREEIIDRLVLENKKLSDRISILDEKVVDLEKKMEANLQYQRSSSVVISGIPSDVNHYDLEGIVLKLFNTICYHSISTRDIIACHRISNKSSRVLIKFVNKKDAISLLDGKFALNNVDRVDIGLQQDDKLYIEEHLSPYISNLAYQCRCLRRNNKIAKIKINKGIVKILKTGEEEQLKWHDILHINDINKLFPVIE